MSVRVTGPNTSGSGGAFTASPSRLAIGRLPCLHVGVARLGHEAALLVAELGHDHDERHRAAPATLLLVDVLDPGAEGQACPRAWRRAVENVFLLGVQGPREVQLREVERVGLAALPYELRGE